VHRPVPFDDPAYLFELKHDGFRALAYVDGGDCRLISRKNHEHQLFGALCTCVSENLKVHDAIMDCEIACVDEYGRSVFTPFTRRLNTKGGSAPLTCFTSVDVAISRISTC